MYAIHADHSGVCGTVGGASTPRPDCEKSFESIVADRNDADEAMLDLEKYTSRMFPWEPIKSQPALINCNSIWFILIVSLVLLVILLALFRAPLPSCWETSS
jgi:hypothetical protein